MSWTRTEPQELRPFFALGALNAVLENIKISTRAGGEPCEETNLFIEQPDFEEVVIEIIPNVENKKVAEVLVDNTESFSWILVIRDPMKMKKSVYNVWEASIGLPDKIVIREDELPKYARDRDFDIILSLCLSKGIEAKSGWPSLIGSWVCQKTFQFKRPILNSSFDIRPLTEEILERNNLPKHSLLHVDLLVNVNELMEEEDSFALVYVSEKILDSMRANRTSGGLLAIMEYEIICGILHTIAEEFDISGEIQKGSPIARIAKQLGLEGENQSRELTKLFKDPLKLRALVCNSVRLTNSLEKL